MWPPCAHPPTNKQRKSLHRSARDLQILRAKRVEAKAVNDDTREARQSAVGHLRAHRHDEEDPRLGVPRALQRLILFEVVVLDALLVAADAVDGNGFFALRQEPGCGGYVGQHKQRHNAPKEAQRTKDEKDVHPLRKPCGDMADSITNQAAKHGGKTVGAVVGLEAQRLFGRCVPDAHDEHKGRVHNRLSQAQEEAVRRDAGKRGARRRRHENSAPDDGRDRNELADWESLQRVGGRELRNEVAKVEDGAEP